MDLACEDDVWRDRIAGRPNALDSCNPFLIALLYGSRPSASIGGCNDCFCRDFAHCKPGLVEVVNIVIVDSVFRDYVPYEGKPRAIRVWIFVEDSLIVDSSIKTRSELGSSSYEVRSPVGSNAWRVAVAEQSIRHFSNTTEARWKRTRI